MDSILEPKNVAEFARDIYILVNSLSPKALASALTTLFGGKMDVSPEDITSAKTGGPGFIKSRTAFGLMAFGKGAYAGHAFIILRGTKKTFPADMLTNMNLSLIHI